MKSHSKQIGVEIAYREPPTSLRGMAHLAAPIGPTVFTIVTIAPDTGRTHQLAAAENGPRTGQQIQVQYTESEEVTQQIQPSGSRPSKTLTADSRDALTCANGPAGGHCPEPQVGSHGDASGPPVP